MLATLSGVTPREVDCGDAVAIRQVELNGEPVRTAYGPGWRDVDEGVRFSCVSLCADCHTLSPESSDSRG